MLGDGITSYGSQIQCEVNRKITCASLGQALQNPVSVGIVAHDHIQKGINIRTTMEALPFYLRKSQAEQQLEMHKGNHHD